MRRLDEIPGLRASLPDPTLPMEVPAELRAAVQEQSKPDAAALMALLDGSRTLDQVLTQSPFDDWTTMRDLSYLLGKALLLRLRADEQARLGSDFSLKGFHDALLYSGNLPISFQRRLLAGEGGGPTSPRS